MQKPKKKKQVKLSFNTLTRSEIWRYYGRAIALLKEGIKPKEIVMRSKINNWKYPVTDAIINRLKKYAK